MCKKYFNHFHHWVHATSKRKEAEEKGPCPKIWWATDDQSFKPGKYKVSILYIFYQMDLEWNVDRSVTRKYWKKKTFANVKLGIEILRQQNFFPLFILSMIYLLTIPHEITSRLF